MRITGVVYLLRKSPLLESDPQNKDSEIYTKMCGTDAVSVVKVVKTTEGTAWNGNSLKESDTERAWEVINDLAQKRVIRTILQIQQELVDDKQALLETEAGRYVYGKGGTSLSFFESILKLFGIGE